jgi:6-phosphogluconolactonase (cycloisomerase 2 family)
MKLCGLRNFFRLSSICLFWLLVTVSGSVSATPRFVYAANYYDASISTYRVDPETGMLQHLRHTPTLKSPSTLVLRPDGQYLYVTSQVLDEIAIYRVDQQSGALTEIKASPVASGVRSNFRLAMSPDGKFLYVPGRFTQNLMVFRSAPETGELTPLADNNFQTHGDRARFVEVTPDGRFVYVTNTNSNSLAAFKIDGATESIEAVDGMPFEASGAPQATMVHPSGKFLYVANWQEAKVSGYTINQETGVLTPIADFDAPAGIYPFTGSIHPSGKYLYVTNFATSNVSGYQINEDTGRLTLIDGMPVMTKGNAPVDVFLDKEGRFAYVPNYSDSALTVFEVDDKTGRLTNPRWMMTRPGLRRLALLEEGEPVRLAPRWLVAADSAKGTINSYAMDVVTGEASAAHSLKLEGLSGALALQSEAGLVYAAQGQSVAVFKLAHDAKLTRLANADVTPKGDILALHVDQSGRHLYVATQNPAQYLAYSINTESGGLQETDRIELPEGTRPSRILATPEQRLNLMLDAAKDRVFVFRYLSGYGPMIFPLERHGSPFTMGKGLADMVIDPSGQFGLVVQSAEGTVAVYRMPTIWGPLQPVTAPPLAVGKRPVAVAMHPQGEHVYVLDADAKRIQRLRLDADSGELATTGESIPVQGVPQALSIDPSGRFAYVSYSSRAGVTRFGIDAATGSLTHPKEMLDNITPSALVFTSVIQ